MNKIITAINLPKTNSITAITAHLLKYGYIPTGRAADILGIHSAYSAINYLTRHKCPSISIPFMRGAISSLTYWSKAHVQKLQEQRNSKKKGGSNESEEV